MSTRQHIFSNFPIFDQIWDLVSQNPFFNKIEEKVNEILKTESLIDRDSQDHYLLTSTDDRNNVLRAICFDDSIIVKHQIGVDRRTWAAPEKDCNPGEINLYNKEGERFIFILSDYQLLKYGCFDLLEIFDDGPCLNLEEKLESTKNLSNLYQKMVFDIYNLKLSKGQMVYIPAYDLYQIDHLLYDRHVWIHDGTRLVRKIDTLLHEQHALTPRNLTLEEFDLEHFLILSNSSIKFGGLRWMTPETYSKKQFLRKEEEGNYNIYTLKIKDIIYYLLESSKFEPYEGNLLVSIINPDCYFDQDWKNKMTDIEENSIFLELQPLPIEFR